MEYESAEPKVKGTSICKLTCECLAVVRKLAQMSHLLWGEEVDSHTPTLFCRQCNATLSERNTVKHETPECFRDLQEIGSN